MTRQWTCAQRRRMLVGSPAAWAAAHLAALVFSSHWAAASPLRGQPPVTPALLLMLCAGLGAVLCLLYSWFPAIQRKTGYGLFALALLLFSVAGWRELQTAWQGAAPLSLWASAGLSLGLACLVLVSMRLRLLWRLTWRGVPVTLAFSALDSLDVEAPGHTRRVARQAVGFGRALGLPRRHLRELRIGALLHDIGKTDVPDEVLLKPGPLSQIERHSMERHVDHGVAWGRRLSDLPEVALCVISAHHERWDGTGYPLRLRGEEIPLSARIVTLCDVFDALTHERVYKPAWPVDEALREIERQAGRAFDPLLVQAFVRYMRRVAPRRVEARAA